MLRCTRCDIEVPPGEAVCRRCQRPIAPSNDAGPSAGQKNPWAFSLAELFITTTYVGLLLAITLATPEWGAVLWGVSAFALARTIWFSVAWKRAGKPFSPLAQIGSFVESLVVMSLVATAATVAFLGVCFPLGAMVSQCCGPNYSDTLFACAWIFGGLAGLGSGGYLLWWLWISPIVRFWKRGEVPTMLARLAELTRTVVVLSSTFLGSATLAIGAGWAWVQSFAEDKRGERYSRIAGYWMFLAGYAAGCLIGIVAGLWATRAGKRWFWPIFVIAVVALIWVVSMALVREQPFTDDELAPIVAGILVAFIVGIVCHRLFSRAASSDDDGRPRDKSA